MHEEYSCDRCLGFFTHAPSLTLIRGDFSCCLLLDLWEEGENWENNLSRKKTQYCRSILHTIYNIYIWVKKDSNILCIINLANYQKSTSFLKDKHATTCRTVQLSHWDQHILCRVQALGMKRMKTCVHIAETCSRNFPNMFYQETEEALVRLEELQEPHKTHETSQIARRKHVKNGIEHCFVIAPLWVILILGHNISVSCDFLARLGSQIYIEAMPCPWKTTLQVQAMSSPTWPQVDLFAALPEMAKNVGWCDNGWLISLENS